MDEKSLSIFNSALVNEPPYNSLNFNIKSSLFNTPSQAVKSFVAFSLATNQKGISGWIKRA